MGKETPLPKGKVQEPVPILRDACGHRLLFGAALSGDSDGLGIVSPLGKPLQQLVGGYLCVLGAFGKGLRSLLLEAADSVLAAAVDEQSKEPSRVRYTMRRVLRTACALGLLCSPFA